MRHQDIRRKRPSRWPWLIAVIVLGLAGWGITVLLAPPAEETDPRTGTTASDTLPPAAIPSAAGGGAGDRALASLDDLAPISARDAGRRVRVSGEVVATANESYWVAADSVVVAVAGVGAARSGDSVTVTGLLREYENERSVRTAQEVLSGHPVYGTWPILAVLRVHPEDGEGTDLPADRDSTAPGADTADMEPPADTAGGGG